MIQHDISQKQDDVTLHNMEHVTRRMVSAYDVIIGNDNHDNNNYDNGNDDDNNNNDNSDNRY